MEVTYTLTEDDFWRLLPYFKQGTLIQKAWWFLCLIWPMMIGFLLMCFFSGMYGWLVNYPNEAVIYETLGVIAAGLGPWGLSRKINLMIKNTPEWFGVRTLRLMPEGIYDEMSSTLFKWEAVAELRRQSCYFLLFLSPANTAQLTLPIPRAAFASPSVADDFYTQAHAYWQASLGVNTGVWPPAPQAGANDRF